MKAPLAIFGIALPSIIASKHSFVTKHDRRTFIAPIGIPFGFLPGGEYKLKVSDYELVTQPKSKSIDTSIDGVHPGFLLKRFESETAFAQYQLQILDQQKCVFDDLSDELGLYLGENEFPNSTLDAGDEGIFMSMADTSSMWTPNQPSLSHTFTAGQEGLYFLMYQVCGLNEDVADLAVVESTFELDFVHFNYDRLGNISYLTAGEMPLPHVFFYFSFSYALLLGLWMTTMKNATAGARKSKGAIYAIHHFMTVLLTLKLSSILFESVRYHFIRVNGHAELWTGIYYFVNFIKGSFLFTVILLIGSGWSFVKPVINDKERKVIFLVLLLQTIDNIALVVLSTETEGEQKYDDWSAVLHMVDIICCCAVLVPIVWQVNALEQSIEESGDDADTSRSLAKLQLFRSFYVLVVGYIYFTRIVVYLVSSGLGYKYTWLRYCLTEVGTLAFYVGVGLKFKPMTETDYEKVATGEEEVGHTVEMTSGSPV